jgi:hypothetical protein
MELLVGTGGQALDAESAAVTGGPGRSQHARKGVASDAARIAPHLRHAVAPGRWRHLQAVEDPRALQRRCHRAALRTLAERGSGGSQRASEDSSRAQAGWQRRQAATATERGTQLSRTFLSAASNQARCLQRASRLARLRSRQLTRMCDLSTHDRANCGCSRIILRYAGIST